MHFYIGNKKSWLLTSGFLVSSIVFSMIYYQAVKTRSSFKLTWTAKAAEDVENNRPFTPTWTAKAAEDAETVAAINCLGHGRAYFDGIELDGVRICECNKCYNGSRCEQLLPNCSADAVTGDAMFLEKYWMERKARSAIVIPGWHRMSYYMNNTNQTFTSYKLQEQIRDLHHAVGNAKAEGKNIVFGNGVTQLLTGLVLSLSQLSQSRRLPTLLPYTAKVVADVPYYPVFRKQTTYFRYRGCEWAGNASDHTKTQNPEDFIELVTSPNNPDGNIKVSKIRGAPAIHDLVYYWPHYTAIKDNVPDHDIMLFSLSKLTGHAGSRFGWALIRDKDLYEKLLDYMMESSEGTSRDTQLRTLSVVKEITDRFNPKRKRMSDIFHFGYETMKRRWTKLNDLVSNSTRFSLQIIRDEHCFFFKEKRQPSPAFGWLKCEWGEDEDCKVVLEKGQILTQGGRLFDATPKYARLSLIKTDDDFDQMMEKLGPLVHQNRAELSFNA